MAPQSHPTPALASSFQHAGVAAAYRHRPPYPPEVFDRLDALLAPGPRHVLDLGAGDGALARPLAARVDRVDAVEVSAAMIEVGRRRPGGDHPHLVWLLGAAETVPLDGSYALATAGASLHWMDWRRTLGRVGRALAPGGRIAIVDQRYHGLPWAAAAREVIVRHSRNPDYDPTFSLPDELERQGLLAIEGRFESAPMHWRQPVAGYVEQFHSTASLARELMAPDEAEAFGEAMAAAVRPHESGDGLLTMQTVASIVWGRP